MSDDFEMEVVKNDELDSLGSSTKTGGQRKRIDRSRDEDTKVTRSKTEEVQEVGEQNETVSTSLQSLPGDWAVRSLGTDFDIEYGNEKTPKELDGEGYPLYGANGIIGRSDEYLFDNPVVTVTCRGATCGNVHLTAPKSWVTNNSLVLLKRREVNNYFLANALRQYSVDRVITGSAQPQITSGMLGRMDYPVPPLDEQRKIASVLYTVDQAIQKTEAIIEQAKRVKRGLMQDFFRTGLVKDRDLEETRIGKIPTDWTVINAGEHLNLVSGAHVKAEHVTTDSTLEPYITGPEDFDLRSIEVSKYTDQPSKFCEPGDILVTVKGSGCGKTAIADRRVCISRQLKALQTDDSLNRDFLFYYLRFKRNLLETLSEGSAIPGLSNSHLLKLDVPLPPEEEQREIGSRLASVDDLVEKNLGYGSRLKEVKKGLMQDLLTGEVRTADKAIDVLEEVETHG